MKWINQIYIQDNKQIILLSWQKKVKDNYI